MADKENLWSYRNSSLAAIEGELRPIADAIDQALGIVDELIENFQKFPVDGGGGSRLCSLVTAKGRNLAVACYSLTLDGLAQEAGAILRPLIEVIELLAYLRLEPGAVEAAMADNLPNAGTRAKRIDGVFQGLREDLNKHASNISMDATALGHLVDLKAARVRTTQIYNVTVLGANMASLFMVVWMLSRESANSFEAFCSGAAPVTAESLLNKVSQLRRRGACIATGLLGTR